MLNVDKVAFVFILAIISLLGMCIWFLYHYWTNEFIVVFSCFIGVLVSVKLGENVRNG